MCVVLAFYLLFEIQKGTGTADGWAKHRPMDDEELMMKQVDMTSAATPGTTIWVYRNSVYGYPWQTAVRQILEDPAYSDWWMKFKPEGPWYALCMWDGVGGLRVDLWRRF